MPKRSNHFQRVVAYIVDRLAPLGASVQESVVVPQLGLSSVMREVDTLIEVSVGVTSVRVAIECRDRGRRATVQWIDELAGKYALLPVDRVIAISSSGFSKAAAVKAERHNIDLLAVRDVLQADWPSRFRKLTIAAGWPRTSLRRLGVCATPVLKDIFEVDHVAELDESGHWRTSSRDEFLLAVFGDANSAALKYVYANAQQEYADKRLNEPLYLYIEVQLTDVWLIRDGARYRLEKLGIDVVVELEFEIPQHRYQLLGEKALLTSARLGSRTMTVVEVNGAAERGVFWEGARLHDIPSEMTESEPYFLTQRDRRDRDCE